MSDETLEKTGDDKKELSREPSKEATNKIDCLLNAVGNSPIMKTRKWAVDQDKQISWIIKFIHKYLKLSAEERIFLYVNQNFAPSPDQTVRNLYACYGGSGKLNLYYCTSPAWG